MPSPFEVGRSVSQTIGGAFKQHRTHQKEKNDAIVIDRILQEANLSEDPEDMQRAICKVLSQVSQDRQASVIAYLQNRYVVLKEKEILRIYGD